MAAVHLGHMLWAQKEEEEEEEEEECIEVIETDRMSMKYNAAVTPLTESS